MADKQGQYGGHDNLAYGQPAPYTAAPPYPGQQPYSAPPYPSAAYGQQSHNASTIVVTQQPQISTVVATSVPDNMGLAIFACLCCFWPLGLFAIFRANESQNALARGDIAAASRFGADARRFSLISIGIGVVMFIVIIIVAIAVPLTAVSYTTYTYSNTY